jgi:dTDP-4-dehydrorhamnose 3,5-epimerase
MVEVRPLALNGVFEILPAKHGDARGFFSETWNAAALRNAGLVLDFVQDNHSYSAALGVLRGMHFQAPPVAQDKLVRVSKGRIFDVAIDIRRASATYGKWVGLEVSAAKWNQILVPKGFAHGFLTLEPDTEVIYKVTGPYSREHEGVLRYDDPDIGIDWPETGGPLTLAPRDRDAPLLRDTKPVF